MQFDAAERAAIAAEYDRRTQPPAFERYLWVFKSFYILAAAVTIAVIAGVWWFRLPGDAVVAGAVAILMMILIGAVPPVFLRGMVSSEAYGRADAALALLGAGAAGPAARRNAAVDVLAYRRYASGVLGKNFLNVAAARTRLQAAAPYVEAVERVLIEERGIEPVFTRAAQ